MWDREYAKASWNGVEFNVLNTVANAGKRLHVEDMPYGDVPFVEVMGSITSSVQITAVFVGPNSLSDANAFTRALSNDPIGFLEHPFLGELSLVFKKSTSTFSSTKKGIVNLNLEFIDQGSKVEIFKSLESLKSIETAILKEAAKDFVRDVASMSAEEITNLQLEFTKALNVLRKIANILQTPSNLLSGLYRQISDAISAVSSIVNAPSAFINQIQSIFLSVVKEVNSVSIDKVKTENVKSIALTDKKLLSRRELIKLISQSNQTNQPNQSEAIESRSLVISIVLAEISLNEIVRKVNEDTLDFNLNVADIEMKYVIERVEWLVKKLTYLSEHETLVMFEKVQEIKHQFVIDHQKIKRMIANTKMIDIVSTTPVILLAYQNETSENDLNRLNTFKHPLFGDGTFKVPNE